MTHRPDTASDPGEPGLPDIGVSEALDRTASEHLDVEPKARELERRLATLFGEHPSGRTGWVSVERDADGVVTLAIADVTLDRVLSLTRRIDAFIEGEADAVGGAADRAPCRSVFGTDGRPAPLHARRWGMR